MLFEYRDSIWIAKYMRKTLRWIDPMTAYFDIDAEVSIMIDMHFACNINHRFNNALLRTIIASFILIFSQLQIAIHVQHAWKSMANSSLHRHAVSRCSHCAIVWFYGLCTVSCPQCITIPIFTIDSGAFLHVYSPFLLQKK